MHRRTPVLNARSSFCFPLGRTDLLSAIHFMNFSLASFDAHRLFAPTTPFHWPCGTSVDCAIWLASLLEEIGESRSWWTSTLPRVSLAGLLASITSALSHSYPCVSKHGIFVISGSSLQNFTNSALQVPAESQVIRCIVSS